MLLDAKPNRDLIDVTRAVAILMVFFFHVCFILLGIMEEPARDRFIAGFPDILSFVWQPFGVDAIFLISAFLLSYAMFAEHARTGTISLRNHFLRRMTRILPVYYAALLIYGLPMGADAGLFVTSALFISVKVHGAFIIPVGWSTEAIMQAYVVLPFILMLLLRLKRVILWCAILAGLMLAARLAYMLGTDEDWSTVYLRALTWEPVSQAGKNLYYDLWFRATPFWFGIALAWAVQRHGDEMRAWLARAGNRGLCLGAVIAGFVLANGLPIHDENAWSYRNGSQSFWFTFITVQGPLSSATVAGFLLFFFYRPGGWAPPGWVTWAGDRLSRDIFGLYLFHFPFIFLATIMVFQSTERAVLNHINALHVIAITVLALVLSVAFAMLIGRYVERPAQGWLRQRLGIG